MAVKPAMAIFTIFSTTGRAGAVSGTRLYVPTLRTENHATQVAPHALHKATRLSRRAKTGMPYM